MDIGRIEEGRCYTSSCQKDGDKDRGSAWEGVLFVCGGSNEPSWGGTGFESEKRRPSLSCCYTRASKRLCQLPCQWLHRTGSSVRLLFSSSGRWVGLMGKVLKSWNLVLCRRWGGLTSTGRRPTEMNGDLSYSVLHGWNDDTRAEKVEIISGLWKLMTG